MWNNCGKKVFLDTLTNFDTTDRNLFNPYTDICPVYDNKMSIEYRKLNLFNYLVALPQMTEGILIGEAPGHHGCRKTGLAFTDERSYDRVKKYVGFYPLIATNDGEHKETSALHVWNTIDELGKPLFLWNIVPFHPYESEDDQLTNRKPTKQEVQDAGKITRMLLDSVDFDNIVAIGRVAEKQLNDMGYDVTYVRHPSYGGSTKFREGILEIFGDK